jgi:hypothetical protein
VTGPFMPYIIYFSVVFVLSGSISHQRAQMHKEGGKKRWIVHENESDVQHNMG